MEYKNFIGRMSTLRLHRRAVIGQENVKYGIHHGQIPIMEYVAVHEGCTQSELAKALYLTPASIAVSTKRLQHSGMIRKENDEVSLRCKRLYITPKGADIVEKMHAALHLIDSKIFEGFSEEEFAQLNAFFDRMISNISDGKSGVLSFFDMVAMKNKLKNNIELQERND